jgi:type VI secretion system protein ImpH
MAHSSGRPGPAVKTGPSKAAPRRPSVIEALLEDPRAFSFTQAVRLLERAFGPEGKQGDDTFLRDQLRVRPYLSLGFPANDLVDIEAMPPDEDASPDAPGRFRLTATFLGLYGPSSPLPTYYNEELLDEQGDDKSVGRDFLDILNHGFFTLFILADTYYRLSRRVCEKGDRDIVLRLLSLMGLGHGELLADGSLNPGALLRATGLLTQFPRSAAGLRGLLSDRIGAPVRIRQCEPRRAAIPLDQCCCLGRDTNSLGEESWLAFETDDAMGKIAVIAGPMDAQIYLRFLPDRPEHAELLTLVRFYCTQPLEFDLEFVLEPGAPQPGRLGETCWSRLGCDVWLDPDPDCDARVLFPDCGDTRSGSATGACIG